MKRIVALFWSFAVATSAWAGAEEVAAAAGKMIKNVKWKPESVIVSDFSCRGKRESAILGIGEDEIVVAVFLGPLSSRPVQLRYSAGVRDPETAALTIEDLDFDAKRFESEVGYLPKGLRPSKKCNGLNLSDGRIDSLHIYWNHSTKKFSEWSL